MKKHEKAFFSILEKESKPNKSYQDIKDNIDFDAILATIVPKPRKVFIPLISTLSTLLIATIVVLVIVFSLGGKVVPVYQGMEIEELSENTTLRSYTRKTADDTGSFEYAYYATLNEDLLLTVKLHNPDNFVILSFTLNGVFYQSYQFQDGSDSENLILRVNAGDVPGQKDYTIDAIKYIDGTEVKDVRFEGNKTITIAIAYDTLPSASINDIIISPISFNANVTLVDNSNLIELANQKAKAVLYKDNIEIKHLELDVGQNNIEFKELEADSKYLLRVIALFNSFDSTGMAERILLTQNITTPAIITDVFLSLSQSSFSFVIDQMKIDSNVTIDTIKLYSKDVLIAQLDNFDELQFDSLSSNTLYTLEILYSYLAYTAKFTKQIVTLAEEITVVSVALMNTDPVKEGEEINLVVRFVNPSNVSIDFIMLNGMKLRNQGGNGTTLIYVKFVPIIDDIYYDIEIDTIFYHSHDVSSEQIVSPNFNDTILLSVDVSVLSFYQKEHLKYVENGKEYAYIIKLSNPASYSIDDISLLPFTTNEIKMIDSNTLEFKSALTVENSISSFLQQLHFVSISFMIDENTTLTKEIQLFSEIYVVTSAEIVEINNIDDLQNMENGRVYSLTNDIDASKHSWSPYPFYGILYGNGYKIQNISIIAVTASQYLGGIFTDFLGIIDDMHIEKFDAYIDSKESVVFGVFAHSMPYGGELNNLSITDANIWISAKYATIGTFVASAMESKITKVSAQNVNFSINGPSSSDALIYIGGLVGTANICKTSNVNLSNISMIISGFEVVYAGGVAAEYSGWTDEPHLHKYSVLENISINTFTIELSNPKIKYAEEIIAMYYQIPPPNVVNAKVTNFKVIIDGK